MTENVNEATFLYPWFGEPSMAHAKGQKGVSCNPYQRGLRETMTIQVRACALSDVAAMRDQYRNEMNCQIVHDSIHARAGWSKEYLLEMKGNAVGYGSLAVAGPWTETHTLYEFYVIEERRQQLFALFEALLANCNALKIETQTNDALLTVMLNTYARNIQAEAILFRDGFETALQPEGASFRARTAKDVEQLKALELDDGAGWVVAWNGEIAGAGGVLYHYNRPYGDVYMKIAESFRRKGFGAYLVQELKRECRDSGSAPAARCNVRNEASRKTLQKAGFVPCGNLVSGEL